MKSLIAYLNDVVAELKKVTWPTREMLITSTIVVLVVSLLFAFYIMGVDKILSLVVGLILKS